MSTGKSFRISFDKSCFSGVGVMGRLLLILVVSVILLCLVLTSRFRSLVRPVIVLSRVIVSVFFTLVTL